MSGLLEIRGTALKALFFVFFGSLKPIFKKKKKKKKKTNFKAFENILELFKKKRFSLTKNNIYIYIS